MYKVFKCLKQAYSITSKDVTDSTITLRTPWMWGGFGMETSWIVDKQLSYENGPTKVTRMYWSWLGFEVDHPDGSFSSMDYALADVARCAELRPDHAPSEGFCIARNVEYLGNVALTHPKKERNHGHVVRGR